MNKKQPRTRVRTATCPKCNIEMYSRARHDYHGCKCGTFVDGGFDYLRYGGPNGHYSPKIRIRYVKATRWELYQDWNTSSNKFGFIERNTKCPSLQS